MQFLEPNELKKLLDKTRNANDHNALRDWTILVLAYRHAMRAEEISSLTLKDVDLKSNTIRVRRVKGSLETVQPIEPAPGGQPWLNERKALRLYLEQRDGKKVDSSDFVFISQKGGQLTTNALWRMFSVRAEAAGIKERSLHSLKHTRASLMLAGGATVAETQITCGHRAMSSTLRYLHTTPEQAAKAARKSEANIF